MKRGQGATELLIILGVGLAVLIILFQFSSDSLFGYSSSFRDRQAQEALNQIKHSSELLYQQGNGAKTKVYITLPEGIESAVISNTTISILFSNGNTIYENFDFSVDGTLPINSGGHWVDLLTLNSIVYVSPNETIVSVCGDGICVTGEYCPEDFGVCTDVSCYEPTCTNGCGSTAIVSAIDLGECDESTVAGSCISPPCICDVSSVCVSAMSNVTSNVSELSFLDLWPYGGLYPIGFTNRINSTSNTFWIYGDNDGWDWKSLVYMGQPSSLKSCVLFTNSTVLTVNIGDEDCDASENEGQGSGAYGIKFYVDSEDYYLLQTGSFVNFSFDWSYVAMAGELDNNEDLWVKSTFGNGSIYAYEDFEAQSIGSSYEFEGGWGWNNVWYVSGDNIDLTSSEYSGKYALQMKRSSNSLDRSVNLSLSSHPFIEFYAYAENLESSDHAYFRVSNNDSTWYTLETWTDGDDDSTWHKYTYDLSSYYFNSSDFYIQFTTPDFDNNNDVFLIDQIVIYDGNINYFGQALDSSNQADDWNEIYWENNPGNSASGRVSYNNIYNLTPLITGEGWYYLTLGAQVYSWDASNEGARVSFDNVTLSIS